MQPQPTTADQAVAMVAGQAHGVVTTADLRAAGLTVAQIRQRRERGSLLPVFRGVYRVGHRAPAIEATYMAATKACGKDSVLSGGAAAHHLGLMRGAPPPPEVTAPTKRLVQGIKTHRMALHPNEQ